MEIGGFCCFNEACTIAGTCKEVFVQKFMNEAYKLPRLSERGIYANENYSKVV